MGAVQRDREQRIDVLCRARRLRRRRGSRPGTEYGPVDLLGGTTPVSSSSPLSVGVRHLGRATDRTRLCRRVPSSFSSKTIQAESRGTLRVDDVGCVGDLDDTGSEICTS